MLLQRSPVERPAELAEAADRLVTERHRLNGLIALLRASQPDASSGVVEPPFAGVAQHPADQAFDTFALEANATLLGDVRRELGEVDRAMRKLAAGSYGCCERCHEPIVEARLAALPATRFCLRDEERFELGDRHLTDLAGWAPDAEPADRSAYLDLWDGALPDDGDSADEPGAEDAAITVRDLLEVEMDVGWLPAALPVGASTGGGGR